MASEALRAVDNLMGMKRCGRRFIPHVTAKRFFMDSKSHDPRSEMVALLPRLRRFARGLTGTKDEGDDLLQAACEKALARLDQFTPGTRLDRWMLQIIKTTYIDRLRQHQRRRPSEFVPDMIAGVAVDARIHEQVEARQELSLVREAVLKLSIEHREVLLLVVADGLSYEDAADVLGVPQGTVMSRLARARRKLALAIDNPPLPFSAGRSSHEAS